jgi:phosphotransferase system enzyme I (PtsI)
LLAPLLVGLGVNHLSVAGQSVGAVRQALANVTLDACRAAGDAALRAYSSAAVEQIAEALTSVSAS